MHAHGRPAEERLANDPRSELWGEHRARYLFACRSFEPFGLRVLDVACGAGFGLQMLRDRGAQAVGVDLDETGLREARVLDGGVPLVCADATRLPVPSVVFDLVVSMETIEHVPDAGALVAELRRVLRPAGRLVLSTPNRLFGPPELHANNPFHVREFSGGELRELLLKHFETVVVHGQRVDRRYRYVPFLMVGRDLSPAALGYKALNRLPWAAKEVLANVLLGRSFYPGEADYHFTPDDWEGAHALVAVASGPRAA